MKIFGLNISIKRQPGPGERLSVIEASLTGHEQIINTIVDRLVQVEKKAEATRRKVYRDEEGSVSPTPTGETEPVQAPKVEDLQPGDIIPPGLNIQ